MFMMWNCFIQNPQSVFFELLN